VVVVVVVVVAVAAAAAEAAAVGADNVFLMLFCNLFLAQILVLVSSSAR
jgi:hypothetical protein